MHGWSEVRNGPGTDPWKNHGKEEYCKISGLEVRKVELRKFHQFPSLDCFSWPLTLFSAWRGILSLMPLGTPGARMSGRMKDATPRCPQASPSMQFSLFGPSTSQILIGSSLETCIYIARARKCGAAFTMAGDVLTAAMIISSLAEVWYHLIDIVCRGRHLDHLRPTQVIFSLVSGSKPR